LGNINDDSVTFGKVVESGSFEGRYVDEYVVVAIIPRDKAIAFRGVKPLDPSGFLDRRVWAIRCRRPVDRAPWCDRWDGTAIDAQYFGDVRPLVTRANSNFESFARLDSADSALSEQGAMQESVAGPVREFDEAKSLLRAEPLHDTRDRWI
jgi:hypothetical protein